MNVLLTSVGRRNYLVSYFQEAVRGDGRVLATDADPNAPALQAADLAFVAPKFDDPDYLRFLVDLCNQHDVDILLSLNDLEVPLIAKWKKLFQDLGVTVVVSHFDFVDTCLDKWKTFEFLSGAGIDTPRTYTKLDDALLALDLGELCFPVVVKPRWGTGSIGIEIVRSREELEWAYHLLVRKLDSTILARVSRRDRPQSVLVQEFVSGDEYGLDVINDLTGKYVCTFVKQKLSMRAGETDKAVTVNEPRLEAIGERLAELSNHIGVLDCDVLVSREGRIAVLEMNPRFGGGYPFSHLAGANIPAAIVAWASGREARPEWFSIRFGVKAAKYDVLIRVG